jgi:hypothetical protein
MMKIEQPTQEASIYTLPEATNLAAAPSAEEGEWASLVYAIVSVSFLSNTSEFFPLENTGRAEGNALHKRNTLRQPSGTVLRHRSGAAPNLPFSSSAHSYTSLARCG